MASANLGTGHGRRLLAAAVALASVAVRAEPAAGPASPVVAVVAAEHGSAAGARVSLAADGHSVRAVLSEIADRAGLQLELLAAPDPGRLDRPLFLTIDRLPLLATLERIVGDGGFIVQAGDPASGTPGRLLVLAEAAEGPPTGTEPDRSPLLDALADPAAGARLAAIGAVDDAEASALDAVAALALGDTEVKVREEAVYVLGERGGEARLPVLEQALTDPDPRVREVAIDALAAVGGEHAAWALAAALDDAEPSLREQAVFALESIGGSVSAVVVERALSDPEDRVRDAAHEVLDGLAAQADDAEDREP